MSYKTGKVIGILLILLSLNGITQANESKAINESNHHWIIRGGVTNVNPKPIMATLCPWETEKI